MEHLLKDVWKELLIVGEKSFQIRNIMSTLNNHIDFSLHKQNLILLFSDY